MDVDSAVFKEREEFWTKNMSVSKTDEDVRLKGCKDLTLRRTNMFRTENLYVGSAGLVPGAGILFYFRRNQFRMTASCCGRIREDTNYFILLIRSCL